MSREVPTTAYHDGYLYDPETDRDRDCGRFLCECGFFEHPDDFFGGPEDQALTPTDPDDERCQSCIAEHGDDRADCEFCDHHDDLMSDAAVSVQLPLEVVLSPAEAFGRSAGLEAHPRIALRVSSMGKPPQRTQRVLARVAQGKVVIRPMTEEDFPEAIGEAMTRTGRGHVGVGQSVSFVPSGRRGARAARSPRG